MGIASLHPSYALRWWRILWFYFRFRRRADMGGLAAGSTRSQM